MNNKYFLPGMIIGVIVIAILWYMNIYNTMITLDESVKNAWAQVENQYQRRLDLIPNLVNVVKGYANHEKETLESVIEKRRMVNEIKIDESVLSNPESFKKFQKIQGELSSALSRLLAITEAYPDLKANENFLALQSQLEGTENRISVERKRYNDAVTAFNTFIRKFPNSKIADGKFSSKELFRADDTAKTAPKVEF